MKCTTCGSDAVKQEDFAVFDIPTEKSADQFSYHRGFIRFALCHGCITKGVNESFKSGMFGAVFMLVGGIVCAALGVFLYFQQGFDWDFARQTIFMFGFSVITLFYSIPKLILVSRKKKRRLQEEIYDHSISEYTGGDSHRDSDYDHFKYELLLDIQTGSRDPNGKLTEKGEYNRYYLPLGRMEQIYKSKFNIEAPPEYLQEIHALYTRLWSFGGDEYYDRKEHGKALESYLRVPPEIMDARVMYRIGRIYEKGCGVVHDLKQAVRWYTQAAELGHTDAQFNLGLMYASGVLGETDNESAFKWLCKSAQSGDSEAQLYVGDMYYLGVGVAQDQKAGLDWLNKAADAGNEEARSYLDKLGASNES